MLTGHILHLSTEPLTERSLGQAVDADIVSVFVFSSLNRKLLEGLPNLKFIATRSTGYDHIDLGYCRERGIPVSNVPSYGENTVAEHTFALILALSRNIHKAFVHTLAKEIPFRDLRGFDLAGKTLGVIGAGRIGLHTIKNAKGFGMRVVAFDTHHDDDFGESSRLPRRRTTKSGDHLTPRAAFSKRWVIRSGNRRLEARISPKPPPYTETTTTCDFPTSRRLPPASRTA